MNELSYLDAAILGVVQGATEFLPVSSSAHLAITQSWLGLDPKSKPILVFDTLSHVGTLIAIIFVFRRSIFFYIQRLHKEVRGGWRGERLAWKFGVIGIVATIVTAVIGLPFKKFFEEAFARMWEVGLELIITGVILGVTARLPLGKKGWREFNWLHGAFIGLAQGIAILPGISRSGATICAATYCGIRRRWAADFSFFIAAPAIVGATVFELKDVMELPAEQMRSFPWMPIMVGSLIALVVGVLSLWWLLQVIQRSRLHYFAPYCWLVGMMALAGVFSK